MGRNYLFHTGKETLNKKTLLDLEKDLEKIIKKYNAKEIQIRKLVIETEDIDDVTKLYEISSKGGIQIHLSNKLRMKPSHESQEIEEYTGGLVNCLGFKESTNFFKRLEEDLQKLCNIYKKCTPMAVVK